jgi:hypothetical protein
MLQYIRQRNEWTILPPVIFKNKKYKIVFKKSEKGMDSVFDVSHKRAKYQTPSDP